jgi:hypothetical protein
MLVSNTKRRYWAMRTSRNTENHRSFIREELFSRSLLRQGWGYTDNQNLRTIAELWLESAWKTTSEDQRKAWHNWRMLLGEAPEPVRYDSMNLDDVVLVPNMPLDARFTLCRIAGSYQYDLSRDPRSGGDFRHALRVQILTPREGVSNASKLVPGGLRRAMKARSRLWSLDIHSEAIESIIRTATSVEGKDLLLVDIEPEERADAIMEKVFEDPSEGLLAPVVKELRHEFSDTAWEHILRAAIEPVVREPEVLHTGGPDEQGADVVIHYPNPFEPEKPFLVAIQVKDWVGAAGSQVAEQLEEIVQSYQGPDKYQSKRGILISIYVALTAADASPELIEQCKILEEKYHIPVNLVAKDSLMRMTLRGLLKR